MSCIILAGGKSTRLGFDKKKLALGGEPLINTIIHRLSPLFEEFICVTNIKTVESSSRLIYVQDEMPGQGPLGGIQTGLRASKTTWNLVIGCDMPFVSVDFVRWLLSGTSDEIDTLIPVSTTGIEPLLALYSKRCQPVIDHLLDFDLRKITDLLDAVRVEYLEYIESKNGQRYPVFFNINTPADLETAKNILDGTK